MADSRLVVASAARTASGNSGAIRNVRGDALALLVDVTASAGTNPTMDLTIEWSFDGSTFCEAETVDQFTQLTGTGAVVKRFDVKANIYRIVWTIGGTSPSFTFTVAEWTD